MPGRHRSVLPAATRESAATPGKSGPPESATLRFPKLRSEALAAIALGLLYLSVMSGHLSSMDGLYMERQTDALVFDQSIKFRTPLWTWRREPTWNSIYGIGLSLVYIPGMLVAAPLRAQVPVSIEPPRNRDAFYMRELYEDPLYAVGGSWIHAVIAALTAWLVARLTGALGFARRASLWAMAFYGIGSPALVYARGDFAQPLEGLCWITAIFAALQHRRGGSPGALVICAAAVVFAILTRPVEGLLLCPAAALLAAGCFDPRQWDRRAIASVLAVAASAVAGVAATLFVNWARFGNPLDFGYPEGNFWVFPDLARWAAVTVSPGRGILWEFPAIVLAPLGVLALAAAGRRLEAIVLAAICAALFTNVAAWAAWWGGWCWGLRLFHPAIPLLAVLAGAATQRLRGRTNDWVPPLLLAGGLLWAIPGVVTDILGGFASGMDNSGFTWKLASYPPYGAWRFLRHAFPVSPVDANTVDILWLRLAPSTGYWSLAVPAVLLTIAAALVIRIRRRASAEASEELRPPDGTSPAGEPQ